MAVRLVQEIVEELGAEVMVNTPLPMRDSAQAGLGFVVVDNGEGEVVRRIELCGLCPEAWHTSENAREKVADAAPMLVIAVGQAAAEALGFHHPIAQLFTRTAIYWQDAHSRRGCFVLFLPEPDAVNKSAWLSQIYKAARYLSGEQSPWDEIGRGPCMGTRMAPTNHYPYDRVWPRFEWQVGCSNNVAWLDQWGLPWCQGHKVLPEKPKTKARRRERVRR